MWIALQIVFTVSGACALMYEILWGRWLATVLGGSSVASSVVLASYMGGLAIGAWGLGRISKKTSRPLLVYVGIEIAIGLSALAVPRVALSFLGLPAGVRTAAAFVALLLPTALLGGTVPLVIAWTRRAGVAKGAALGRLYGLNTIGAAGGCLLAGFALIPSVGLTATNHLAAATNIALGLIVFALSRRRTEKAAADDPQHQDREAGSVPPPALPLHAAALISGLATLGLEVLWIRLLRTTLGSTTYTFTLVIGTFILGIGLGGFAAGLVKKRADVKVILAAGQLALVALLLAQFALLPASPALFDALRAGADPWLASVLGSAILCTVMLLPVTVVVGFLFPLLGRLYMDRGHRGQQVGTLYGVNTVGAVLGAIVTAMVLVPVLGTAVSFVLLVAMAAVGAGIYANLARAQLRRSYWIAGGAVVLTLVGCFALRPGWNYEYLGKGGFLGPLPNTTAVVYFDEGVESTVLVERVQNQMGLRVDGKPVASTVYIDKANQVLLGHIPALLASGTDRALVVGLGTGMTLDSVAAHQFGELDLVELEPAMLPAARQFSEYNGNVLDRPELRVTIDDGFNVLQGRGATYDVITSDPIQPYFRGAATLYSRDYFSRARRRLSPDGVMAHWLPLANMSTEDFRLIVRTFIGVFPYARLYWTGGAADSILVGAQRPWKAIDPARFQRVRDRLDDIFIHSPGELEALAIADRDTLERWAGRGQLNVIDAPALEFSAPKSLYVDTTTANIQTLFELSAGAGHSVEARAVHRVLGVRAGRPDGAFRELLECDRSTSACVELSRSGLVRRTAWSHWMAIGDREIGRFAKVMSDRERAGKRGPTPPELERGLRAYIRAAELAHERIPDERDELRRRLRAIEAATARESMETRLVGKLRAAVSD